MNRRVILTLPLTRTPPGPEAHARSERRKQRELESSEPSRVQAQPAALEQRVVLQDEERGVQGDVLALLGYIPLQSVDRSV